MKKLFILIPTVIVIPLIFSLTDVQIKRQAEDLLENVVTGHNFAFGEENIYKKIINLNMWDNAISRIKTFVTTTINENKNFLGMKDSTLTKALDKITEAETLLINTIKVTRGVLQSPKDLEKQIIILNKIKNDMLIVQKTLSSSMTPLVKDEARKLLNSLAMFIETTAAKAIRDAKK